MDGEAGHTQHSAAEEKNRAAAVAPGQAQERQARSLAEREGGRCWSGSRNLELAPMDSWVGCLGSCTTAARSGREEQRSSGTSDVSGGGARRGERVQW
jgi:hypothetical protein